MRIACDIDGVLYKWEPLARKLLHDHRGIDLPASESWDFIKENVSPKDWRWLWSEGPSMGLWRHATPYPYAQQGLEMLKRLGHVALISHRPESAIADTYTWLARYGLVTSELHIVADGRKSDVLPHADVYIDDNPDVVVDVLLHTDAHIVCFGRPWNSDIPSKGRLQRAIDWREVVEHVRRIGTTRHIEDRGGEGVEALPTGMGAA
jgi:5'(3')-deoxyribonucleotidase